MARFNAAKFLAGQSREKVCRKCGRSKTLAFFPRDRSRADGCWHTCRLCNSQHWKATGKQQAALKRARERAEKITQTGLRGLRQYGHSGDSFASMPYPLRWTAERLLNKYLAIHRDRMTPALYASLHATAASNAHRVGDRSWARRMWRIKGYRRAERIGRSEH